MNDRLTLNEAANFTISIQNQSLVLRCLVPCQDKLTFFTISQEREVVMVIGALNLIKALIIHINYYIYIYIRFGIAMLTRKSFI